MAKSTQVSLKMTGFTPASVAEAKEVIKATGATSRPVHLVPIEHIKVAPGFNVRVTDSDDYRQGIQLLKHSIITEGFYPTKPLSGYVAKDKTGTPVLYVTDGHRRLDAAKAAIADGADLTALPVILRSPGTSALDLSVALEKENSGQPLTMLEKAVLAKRLLSTGMTQIEVAERLSYTPRNIANLMTLITAPKEVRALVSAGKVAGTVAVKAVDKHGEKAIDVLTELVAKAEATGRKTTTQGDLKREGAERMVVSVTRVEFTRGQTVEAATIEPFLPLFGDSDWFTLTDEEGQVEITEPIELVIRVRRPKRIEVAAPAEEAVADVPDIEDEEAEAIDTRKAPKGKKAAKAEPAPKAKKANGKSKKAAPPPSDDDDDDFGDEDGITSADLATLGIADPAADL